MQPLNVEYWMQMQMHMYPTPHFAGKCGSVSGMEAYLAATSHLTLAIPWLGQGPRESLQVWAPSSRNSTPAEKIKKKKKSRNIKNWWTWINRMRDTQRRSIILLDIVVSNFLPQLVEKADRWKHEDCSLRKAISRRQESSLFSATARRGCL
jgi:hypothetical protein